MNNDELLKISTFAEFMICPNLITKVTGDVSAVGYTEFSSYKFRQLSSCYRGDSIPDEDILLEKIKESTIGEVRKKNKIPLLLLSDGKDSMGLALALASAGVQSKTLTFLRRDDHSLKVYIQSVAEKLGHEPYFVNVDEIQSGFNGNQFLKGCASMETPVLDQGFLFFLFGCQIFFAKSGFDPSEYVIVDGLGNDEYFGYLPSKNQLKAFRMASLGFWKILPRKRLPFFRWYFRSPAEAHGDLSALAAFFPFGGSYNLNAYFSSIPKSSEAFSFIDFRAFSRGSFHDHQCMMGKTIATAKSLGCDVVFPWVDSGLADYCFNLPATKKFDFSKLKNKLLLRELLSIKISWSQEKRGVDLFFDLNMEEFKRVVLLQYIPEKIVNVIDASIFLSESVKKRAYLELLNLYGFCRARGVDDGQVENILYGRIS